eukprot:233802_1
MAMIMNILYNGYLEILLQFYMVSVVMWCRFMSLPVMSKSYQHIHIKRQKYKGNKVTYGKEQQAKGEVGEQQKEKTQQSKRKVGKGTYEKNKRSKKRAKENTTNEKVNIHNMLKGKLKAYNQSEGNMVSHWEGKMCS